jgi:hypothetical protein
MDSCPRAFAQSNRLQKQQQQLRRLLDTHPTVAEPGLRRRESTLSGWRRGYDSEQVFGKLRRRRATPARRAGRPGGAMPAGRAGGPAGHAVLCVRESGIIGECGAAPGPMPPHGGGWQRSSQRLDSSGAGSAAGSAGGGGGSLQPAAHCGLANPRDAAAAGGRSLTRSLGLPHVARHWLSGGQGHCRLRPLSAQIRWIWFGDFGPADRRD